MEEIVYFELNNWASGIDYPNAQPFLGWMNDDLNICFRSDEWAKENKICVVINLVDMSQNFCVTATKKWVEKNCPELLTKYSMFLRQPDKYGDVVGRFGTLFLEYEESNFGVTWDDDD